MSRRSSHDPSSPRLQPRGRFDWGFGFGWIDLCADLRVWFGWFLVTRAEVVVSPPFVFLPQVKGLLRLDFAVAAQNCWVRKGGAFTGEIRLLLPLVLNFDVSWLALW